MKEVLRGNVGEQHDLVRVVEFGPRDRHVGRTVLDIEQAVGHPRQVHVIDPDVAAVVGHVYGLRKPIQARSEEHTSELQSLMRISYAVFCLKKKKQYKTYTHHKPQIIHTQSAPT